MSVDRFEELMALRAIDGISPAEESELARLSRELSRDPEEFERLMAELSRAAVAEEPLPEALRDRLETAAVPTRMRPRPAFGWRLLWALAGAVATAAFFLITGLPQAGPASLERQRQQLIETAQDSRTLPFSATEDAAATQFVEGDVVWSQSRQEGFMRIEGLAVNDPREEQYQLWIFDAERDDRYPLDGGLFDILPGKDVVIPISVPVPVGSVALFAVTVEAPGGVVVSDRSRIALVAKPE